MNRADLFGGRAISAAVAALGLASLTYGQCTNDCGTGDAAEGEACLVDFGVDAVNGGCFGSTPPIFSPATCGEAICGVVSTYNVDFDGDGVADSDIRDTDWYLLTQAQLVAADVDGDGVVQIRSTLRSEFSGVTFILTIGNPTCADINSVSLVGDIGFSAQACAGGDRAQATLLVADLPNGVVVFVSSGNPDGSGIFDGFECAAGQNDYVVVIQCLDLNEPPTAVAGSDQSIHAGQTVFLNGSASFDDNTATANLLFAWSFTARPIGSTVSLTGAGTATPSFVADLPGTYRLQLVVTDEGGLSSDPDEIVISSTNLAPTADAGNDAVVVVGFFFDLDGSGSFDPEGDPLAFSWSFQQRPAGSTAALFATGTDMPFFIPDLPGIYVVQLVVSDSFDDSAPDTVTITVISGEDVAENTLIEARGFVANLSPDHVTTTGNQRALTNFLSQAIGAIQVGDIDEALRKIDNALERTDGCVLRGGPDGNGPGRDWITDCVDQVLVYASLILAKEALSL